VRWRRINKRGAPVRLQFLQPIVVGTREARGRGRESFRPQRRPASPPGAIPSGRDPSRPSSGMAPRARARLSHPGRGIRRSRSGDLKVPVEHREEGLRVGGRSSLCTPRAHYTRGRRAQVGRLSSGANGTAVSSGSQSSTRGTLGMAVTTAAFVFDKLTDAMLGQAAIRVSRL
jgi:hypothetical protein